MRPNALSTGRGRLARVALAFCLTVPAQAAVGDVHDAAPRTPSNVAAAARVALSVSPDGRWLLVHSRQPAAGASELSIIALADGSSRSLGTMRCDESEPAWDGDSRLRVRVIDEGRFEVRTIDPASCAVIDVAPSELEPPAASWARVEVRMSTDGREVQRVEWLGRGLKFHVPVEQGACQIASTPGIVYYSQRAGTKLSILRQDMEHGTTDEVAVLDQSVRTWSISPDGRALLVTEADRPHRARVIDTRNGMLIDGPWPAESAQWLDDGASRYVTLVARDRRVLVDRVRDRELDLGLDQGAWPVIEPLRDGRFVVQSERGVELCDDELRSVRMLLAKAD